MTQTQTFTCISAVKIHLYLCMGSINKSINGSVVSWPLTLLLVSHPLATATELGASTFHKFVSQMMHPCPCCLQDMRAVALCIHLFTRSKERFITLSLYSKSQCASAPMLYMPRNSVTMLFLWCHVYVYPRERFIFKSLLADNRASWATLQQL